MKGGSSRDFYHCDFLIADLLSVITYVGFFVITHDLTHPYDKPICSVSVAPCLYIYNVIPYYTRKKIKCQEEVCRIDEIWYGFYPRATMRTLSWHERVSAANAWYHTLSVTDAPISFVIHLMTCLFQIWHIRRQRRREQQESLFFVSAMTRFRIQRQTVTQAIWLAVWRSAALYDIHHWVDYASYHIPQPSSPHTDLGVIGQFSFEVPWLSEGVTTLWNDHHLVRVRSRIDDFYQAPTWKKGVGEWLQRN